MIKYTICYPYYRRGDQFRTTAQSLVERYRDRGDIEILLIVDPKNTEADIQNLWGGCELLWPFFTVRLIQNDMFSYSSAHPYNLGAQYASGKYFVLSNPECMHITDVFSGMDEEFDRDPSSYVVCACVELDNTHRQTQWYQHSIHNPRCLHFCTALYTETFKLVGFDERYCRGLYYEDNDFIQRIQQKNLRIVQRDDLLVAHQYHDRSYQAKEYLLEKNKKLYQHIWEGGPA